MKTPTLYKVAKLKSPLLEETTTERLDGRWVPARPMGLIGLCLLMRLRLAWGVFTGRYDAMDWEENLYKGNLKGKDPVKECPVYCSEGCAHVDGYLCDMRDCDILRGFVRNKEGFIQKPFGNVYIKNDDSLSQRACTMQFTVVDLQHPRELQSDFENGNYSLTANRAKRDGHRPKKPSPPPGRVGYEHEQPKEDK